MNKRILTAVFAALISLPLVVNAADEKKKGGFAAMDKDGDGKISKKEYVAAQKDAAKAETRFGQLDKNSDGFLSKDELAAGQKKKK
jgi:Ca2+-binding EF-hand superfamily protein